MQRTRGRDPPPLAGVAMGPAGAVSPDSDTTIESLEDRLISAHLRRPRSSRLTPMGLSRISADFCHPHRCDSWTNADGRARTADAESVSHVRARPPDSSSAGAGE